MTGGASLVDADTERVRQLAHDTLLALGLTEVVTNSLVNPSKQKQMEPHIEPLVVANPPNPDQSVLRISLEPLLFVNHIGHCKLSACLEQTPILHMPTVFSECFSMMSLARV